jgi:hypothetical protein
MTSHESQYFDWLPWTNGELDEVPEGEEQRHGWLLDKRKNYPGFNWSIDFGRQKYHEEFEICEFGRQPADEEIKMMFPMTGK